MTTIIVNGTTYTCPYLHVVPALTAEETRELRADIQARGVVVPVAVTEDHEILDGHNRLRIAADLGLTDIPVKVMAGLTAEQRTQIALDLNLHRRHLTREQKQAVIAAKLKADPSRSDRAIGSELRVDNKTVAAVRSSLRAPEEIPQLPRRRGRDGRARRIEPKAIAETESTAAHNAAAAPPQGHLLGELKSVTERLQTILARLGKADWSQEDTPRWDAARAALNEAVNRIAAKVREGFKKVKPAQLPVQEASIRELKSLYGEYAPDVLSEYLEEQPKTAGATRRYRIVAALPTQEAYQQLQKKKYTSTVAELVNAGFSTLAGLAEELGRWYDNMPAGLQAGAKGEALDEARNTLDNLAPPDRCDRWGTLEVYCLPHQGSGSRPARRDAAVGQLQAVVDFLTSRDDKDAESLIHQLEDAIAEAEAVEFPGMY
jgi:ParB-like chromosome segregation protein Spo0J